MSNEATTIEANTAEGRSALKRFVMCFWPFGKKAADPPEVDTFSEAQRELEKKIFKAFPLFSEFEYMSVTCRVTFHQRFVRGFCVGNFYQPDTRAMVACDYVDKGGEIHNVSFRLDELEALLDA